MYTVKKLMNKISYEPILLAEDNADDVFITRRAWKKGHIKNKLYVVNDGEQALEFLYRIGEYAYSPRPCLMLLDLKMPRVDGFEVLETIKEDTSLKKMPVIILTTSSWTKDIEYAYDLGANSYIVKPVSFWNFLQTIIDLQKYWQIACEIPSPSKYPQR